MSEEIGIPDPAGTFDEPYTDVDEWRDVLVRHRYVHGGFAGTETRFSIYLPPPDLYKGRFFQHITPVPDSENLAQLATGEEDKIGFSVESGAFFLETNGGGVSGSPGSSGRSQARCMSSTMDKSLCRPRPQNEEESSR